MKNYDFYHPKDQMFMSGNKCKNENCKVSFYISTFNSEGTVEKSLLSILNQEVDFDYCVTVIDDGSLDSTPRLLRELSEKHKNMNLMLNNQNLGAIPGVSLARRKALEYCSKSKFMALGSDHDVWSKDFLSNAIKSLSNNPEVTFYVPDLISLSQKEIAEFGEKQEQVLKIRQAALPPQEIYSGAEALFACRAGQWVYGLERKNNVSIKYFFPSVDAPDQVYMYPMVYLFGAVIGKRGHILVKKKNKLEKMARRNYHLVSQEASDKIKISIQNKFQRYFTICKFFYQIIFEEKKFKLHLILFNWHLFLKINKSHSLLSLISRYSKRLFTRLKKSFRYVQFQFNLILTNLKSFLFSIFAFRKKANSVNKFSRKIGLYVTTPGILRLVEYPIKRIIENKEVELIVFATKKSWQKKLTQDHDDLVAELVDKYSNFKVIFLPKNLSELIHAKSMKLKKDSLRLALNSRFYSHPDLEDETLAASRSYVRFGFTKKKETDLSSSLIVSKLENRYKFQPIARYFTNLGIDVMLLSPIVNAHETEVISFSLKNKIKLIGVVASWDNLTVKGQLIDTCDSYIVWSNGQKNQAVKYHNISPTKIKVSGPYAFMHLFQYIRLEDRHREFNPKENLITSNSLKILWLCSSAFIVDVKERGKFVELDEIYHFIMSFKVFPTEMVRLMQIRLHPNCGYEIDDAVKYLNGKIGSSAFNKFQFSKFEPVTFEERSKYLKILDSCDVVVGYATSAIVEASILGKYAFSPLTDLARRSYSGILHGKMLLRENGGPVQIIDNLEEWKFTSGTDEYFTATGKFSDLIGLNLDFDNYDEQFREFVLDVVEEN